MSDITAAQLKADAEELAKIGDEILGVAEDLPIPEPYEGYVQKADAFVKNVAAFLA